MTVRGQVIADRYQLDREIGQGAMGSVWLSKHLTLGTPVAVKLISGEAARDPDALARFAREAQLAARIRSRHVVQVLDHGHHDDLPYIVMEYLEGESLRARLDAAGRLDLAETTTMVRHIARALTHAHGVGLVHRDIKPENIFVTTGEDDHEKVYKVLDFGVAKVTDELARSGVDPTRTGAMLGTPYYLSPEQAAGLKTLDFRSDLWALAVLAFECLSGKLPFSAPALGPLIAQITLAPIPVLSEHAPGAGVTPQMDEWMARGLCREPDGRFASARDMAEAFAAATGIMESRPPEQDSAVMPAPFMPTPSAVGRPAPLGDSGHQPAGATPPLGDSGHQPAGATPPLGDSGHQPADAEDLAKTAMLQSDSDLQSTVAFPDGYPGADAAVGQLAGAAPADGTAIPAGGAATAPADPAAAPPAAPPAEGNGTAPADGPFAPLPIPAMPPDVAAESPGAGPDGVTATPGKPRSIDSLIREPWPDPVEVPKKSSALPLIIALVAGLVIVGGGAGYYFFVMDGEAPTETETAEDEDDGDDESSPDDDEDGESTATASSAPPPDPSTGATASSAAPPPTEPPPTEPPPTEPPPTKPPATATTTPKPVPTPKPTSSGGWSHRKTL